ncbi:MAG: exodeoxyribonuclease VII large subunit [Calditrichales bacterium]|nr:MAG: exodeoxyribonuclease VII large subunit [Calditrichales bacterium]
MFEQQSFFGPRILSVTDITKYLRALFESDQILNDVWVSGEVSTLSTPASGHIYFTLKDGAASLRCVIWRTQAARLRVPMKTGMAVEVHGAVSIYEASGQYQLYVDAVRASGEGLLYQEFLRLKAQLEAEGLFDLERKRELPQFPSRIGIVTSSTGAALQDMLNTIQQRFPIARVVLAPTMVQGEEAPPKIVAAIEALNRSGNVDVIILARGGGSLEDLWAFNDERVVRAVAASLVPVVTGVGHETDTTLVDYAADVRAPTPTGAAMLATPDKADLLVNLSAVTSILNGAFEDRLMQFHQHLTKNTNRLLLISPMFHIRNDRQRLDELSNRLVRDTNHQSILRTSKLEGIHRRLSALNPMQVLKRGYAVVRDAQGNVLMSVETLKNGSLVDITLAEGQFDAEVRKIKQPEKNKDQGL